MHEVYYKNFLSQLFVKGHKCHYIIISVNITHVVGYKVGCLCTCCFFVTIFINMSVD